MTNTSFCCPYRPPILYHQGHDDASKAIATGLTLSRVLASFQRQDGLRTLHPQGICAYDTSTGCLLLGDEVQTTSWIDVCSTHLWPRTSLSVERSSNERKGDFLRTFLVHKGLQHQQTRDQIANDQHTWHLLPFVSRVTLFQRGQATPEDLIQVPIGRTTYKLHEDLTVPFMPLPSPIFASPVSTVVLLLAHKHPAVMLWLLHAWYKNNKHLPLHRYMDIFPSYTWVPLQCQKQSRASQVDCLFLCLSHTIRKGEALVRSTIGEEAFATM